MNGPQPGTPTPWVVEEGHIQRDSNGIRYWQITDGQDAIACNQFCYAGYDPAVNAANAAAIVHRVNNWDALEAERDALQARVDALVEAVKKIAFLRPAGDVETCAKPRKLVEEMECLALAALSQGERS